MRRLGPVAAGLFASALLLYNTAASRERDLDRLLTPRRFWEDVTVAASCLAHRTWPGAPAPNAAARLPAARNLAEAAILDAAAEAGIGPAQPFRTVPPPKKVVHELVTLRRGDDKGRALLLSLGFKLLSGVAPALGLWLGAFAAIPVLFWTAWELWAAGSPRAAAAFPVLLACSSYFVQVLSLPYSAAGFYTLAIAALVPLGAYALLGQPTLRGLLLRAGATGAVVALCALCRSGTLLAFPGFLLVVALGLRRAQGARPYALVLMAGSALMLTPWFLVRPQQHRQPWMALWQGLGDFDRTYGHSFYDPDAKQALREAGVELPRDVGVEFENPDNDRVFRKLFFESIERDPLWYAAILAKRVGATLVQAPLWSSRVARGAIAATGGAARDRVQGVYYRMTRTADWFGLGQARFEVPMPLLMLPAIVLAGLSARRGATHGPLLLAGCAAVAALGLPVLITTASALEPQAFMLVHLLALGLCLDAMKRS
jgi:hypothetical protein